MVLCQVRTGVLSDCKIEEPNECIYQLSCGDQRNSNTGLNVTLNLQVLIHTSAYQ